MSSDECLCYHCCVGILYHGESVLLLVILTVCDYSVDWDFNCEDEWHILPGAMCMIHVLTGKGQSMTRFSPDDKLALLALANGMCFEGISVGAPGTVAAEVLFNTSITGYQEILTDPSYAQQIITLTYPHIGNMCMNADDWESDRVSASGLIIRDLSPVTIIKLTTYEIENRPSL